MTRGTRSSTGGRRRSPRRRSSLAATPAARLPYVIELWDLPRLAPERIIGRAASALVARAFFDAAQRQHLGRRIVLRKGARLLAATA